MVSAAIVLIAVTNFCIMRILGNGSESARDLASAIWPFALPSSVAVILIMSTLYHTLQDLMKELEFAQLATLELAQRDVLTGLANRQVFDQKVSEAIARYARSGEKFCLLMIDLDNFKRVNDLLGHHSGDIILKEAANRLSSLVREIDTVARFGGDEFLILQTNVKSLADAQRLCSRITRRLEDPYMLGEREISLPGTIGAAFASDDFECATDYARAADVALYVAKGSGKNCSHFFTRELDAQLQRRGELENDLRIALHDGEGLSVQFQPQLHSSGEVVGVEALFRWHHPRFGDIDALEAVSIAEDCGMIQKLGEYVIRKAAQVALRWPSLSVAVNISPAQFSRDEKIADRLRNIVVSEGVRPSQFELEITERLFMDEYTRCEKQMEQLRKFGFRLALDDFGTGYSSLSYLRRFKVDRLKLDRTFASNSKLQESIAILRAAVLLAHSLGLEVVAEGIETKLQEAIALEAGCDVLQGHRYAMPMTVDRLASYLLERKSTAA